jgi:hypothetical protein
MPTNYDVVVESLQLMCEVPTNNTDDAFQGILPRAFEYADNRIYRELDMLPTTVATVGTAFTAGDGRLAVPTQFVSVRYVNLVSPPGVTSGDAGTRAPMERVSPEFMDFTWPTAATTSGSPSIPSKYCFYGTTAGNAFSSTGALTMRVSPAPSTAYLAEFVGSVRPSPLSPTNPNTILTTRYPDLFLAACMIFLMAYQRDWGGQASDPAASQSWEAQYGRLREGVIVEIERQKSQGQGWSTQTPSMLANQPRDRAGSGGGGG